VTRGQDHEQVADVLTLFRRELLPHPIDESLRDGRESLEDFYYRGLAIGRFM